MAAAPSVRARHMKELLAAVRKLPAADAARVDALVPADVRRRIDDATGVEWLDLADDLVVTRAVHDGLGPARFQRFFREQQVEAFSGPLLRIVVEAGLRVFRVDPASFAGWIARGWGLVFRDCGTVIVERGVPGEARLRLTGLPPACATDEIWVRSVAHSLDAVFDVARTRGECTVAAHDPARGEATFRLAWK